MLGFLRIRVKRKGERFERNVRLEKPKSGYLLSLYIANVQNKKNYIMTPQLK